MIHFDQVRNIHIKFASVKQRDKFLLKMKEAEQARMKELIHGNFKTRFR